MPTTTRLRLPDGSSCRKSTDFARIAALCLVVVCGTALAAQSQTPPDNAALQRLLEVGLHAEPSGETATVVFFNRPIVVLRARVLGRAPAERALSSSRLMDDLISGGEAHQVETRVLEGAALVMAGGRTVLVLTPPDVDELSGETLDQAAAGAARRLQQALDEAYEARTPARLMRSAAVALAVLLTGVLLAIVVARSHRAVSARLVHLAETTVTKSGIADANLLRASRLIEIQRRLTSYVAVVLYLVICLQRHRDHPAPVPVHETLGRVDARVSVRDRYECRSGNRPCDTRPRHDRDHRVPDAFHRPPHRPLVPCDRAGQHRGPEMASSRNRAAHAPAVDGCGLVVRDCPDLSLRAGEPDRCVQGRQRAGGPHRHARFQRADEPGHEQFHDHVLSRAAGRRFRADRRGRRNGDAAWDALDQDPYGIWRRGDHSQCGRDCADDHGLFADGGRGRADADLGDDRIRLPLAPGAFAAADGRHANAGHTEGSEAVRLSGLTPGLLRSSTRWPSRWSARTSASTFSPRSTPTSRISSTSTASRSCPPTIWATPPRRRSCRRTSGLPRRHTRKRSVLVKQPLQVGHRTRFQQREPEQHTRLLRVQVERCHQAELVVLDLHVPADPSRRNPR